MPEAHDGEWIDGLPPPGMTVSAWVKIGGIAATRRGYRRGFYFFFEDGTHPMQNAAVPIYNVQQWKLGASMAITEDAAYARVICPVHGAQGISRRNFDTQIASEAAAWECPTCGRPAGFDEAYFHEHHGTPGAGPEATS